MSWVIVDTTTNKAVFETFDKPTVDDIKENHPRYAAVPALDYLVNLNREIKEQCIQD
ncbi:MAG: hypothetical protein ABUJ92_00030 [Desulfobacterales bacterium]